MKLMKWLGYPFVALHKLYKSRGLLYTVYYITLGMMIGLIKHLWNDVKKLGWLLGAAALVISTLLFFAPTIVGGTIYAMTGNAWWLSVATAYFLWVVYPTGSSLWFVAIATAVIEILKVFKIKR